ncbi:MAG: GNAT family N-acetyltransferase [Candidatus Marsarchaeota archaeon]|nr:GNAT family N-acetyltransferase [Candidatus Marsarchaeota archaeon]
MGKEEKARFTVRLARPGDMAAIMEIERTAFRPAVQASKERIGQRRTLFPQGFRVGEHEGQVVAWVSSLLLSEETLRRLRTLEEGEQTEDENLHRPDGRILYIRSLGVRPASQRQGFGQALMDDLLSLARKNGWQLVVLLAEPKNEKYYVDKFGFERTSDYRLFQGGNHAVFEKRMA